MEATDVLKEEHHGVKISLRILEQLCAKLAENQGAQGTPYEEDLGRLIEFFKVFVDRCHHAKEEGVLFPALIKEGASSATEWVRELLEEHAAGRKLVAEMAEALKSRQAGNRNALPVLRGAAGSYVQLLTGHIDKEDHDLYPIADRKISAMEQREMSEVFEKIETDRIGRGTHEKFHVMLDEFKQKYLQH